ncbi:MULTISPECIES: hypothetical protein [Burkholderia]|uniref:Lipoprotein n=1 Tax=Burkholderia diffusa TaxID=488732 RepID=A0A6P2PNZ2_9BURK|nr:MULTISPECIES: hypothetical protein [Burkholderia]KAB0662386.1 hypothetical protein F7R23_02900 [Burkholderia diffusa]MBM2655830.1 hypothetical protein [Burkholderia diffusa]RQZ57156.1 hypothetical protein DIE08_35060 [Burkholderia sp. Bp9004]VWC11288.1 hypothetical protein BDI24065_05364 [Burkholderia diffusa]
MKKLTVALIATMFATAALAQTATPAATTPSHAGAANSALAQPAGAAAPGSKTRSTTHRVNHTTRSTTHRLAPGGKVRKVSDKRSRIGHRMTASAGTAQ